jgi:hypothetical protein
MDAGHFDTLVAYAAINTLRLDDLRPHIYRTRDGGQSWTHITSGIPDGATVNAVREDPRRRGLLFAGTELAVHFSIDDGDHWQSLRLNMPATSIRDLVIKHDDLVVGTHGRSFWILDDITPLRQLDATTATQDVVLFQPQDAWRVRWNKNTDTPLPPDEPAGQNPPDGAIITYWLQAPASTVTVEILDGTGGLVRRYASNDPPDPPLEGVNVPPYWIRPEQRVASGAGMHRFVWDVHYPRPAVLNFSYPIAAIYMSTPKVPYGPWAMPGDYTVRLTVDGRSQTQPLSVKIDPRVKTSVADLARQFELSQALAQALQRDSDALRDVQSLRRQIRDVRQRLTGRDASRDLASLDEKLAALEGRGGGFGAAAGGSDGLAQLNGQLGQLYGILQGADVAPTTQAVAAIAERQQALEGILTRWEELQGRDVGAVNDRLRRAGLPQLQVAR